MIKQAKINQFDKLFEILEEQYIDKEIDVPGMLRRKVPTAQPVYREQWRCIRCSLSTQLTTFPWTGRGKCRAGTAQWQDPGDVCCDATQVPKNQKGQKTVEILQVQFIDKVVEISEIMQGKDKCQRSRRYGNSRKFPNRIVDVPVVLKRQCHPIAQVLERVPTTCAKDAKVQKDPNVSPQASQTPSAKTRFTRKSRERQPMKGCQRWWRHEREQYDSTRHVDWSISAHTGLSSRRARRPAKRKTAAKVKVPLRYLTRKRARRIKMCGDAPVQDRQRESHHNTRREVGCDSDKRNLGWQRAKRASHEAKDSSQRSQTTERDTRVDDHPVLDEPQDHAVAWGRDENPH